MAPEFGFFGVADTVMVSGDVYLSPDGKRLIVPEGEGQKFSKLKLPRKLKFGRSNWKGKIIAEASNSVRGLIGNQTIAAIEERK